MPHLANLLTTGWAKIHPGKGFNLHFFKDGRTVCSGHLNPPATPMQLIPMGDEKVCIECVGLTIGVRKDDHHRQDHRLHEGHLSTAPDGERR